MSNYKRKRVYGPTSTSTTTIIRKNANGNGNGNGRMAYKRGYAGGASGVAVEGGRTIIHGPRYGAVPFYARTIRGITETKYVDGFLNSTGVHEQAAATNDTWADCELNPNNAAGAYGCLPVPRQGTNYADRDGRKIFVKSIKIKGLITFPNVDALTAAPVRGFVRLILVKDTRTNGAELNAEDVMAPGLGSDGAAAQSGNAAIMVLTDPDGWGRYKIMKQKFVFQRNDAGFFDGTDAGVPGYKIPFSMTIKPNCYINFDSSTGAVGSIVDNSFHLIGMSSTQEGAPTITYIARTSFVG